MALQCGPLLITGTIDDVCFYKMHGKYYARMKSSLTRKRVLKDPKFQLTRTHAALLGEASKIASRVYRQITGERKKHALYREITGKAIYLLREGKDKEVVFQWLMEEYVKVESAGQDARKVHNKDSKRTCKPFGTVAVGLHPPKLKKAPIHANVPLGLRRWRRRHFITKIIAEKQSGLGP